MMRAVRAGKYKRVKDDKPKITGLLNGINTLKCGMCGGGMSCNRTGIYYRYACINAGNGKSDHKQWGTPIQYIEKYIVQRARIKAFQSISQPTSDEVKELLSKQDDLNHKLESLEDEYREYRSSGMKIPRLLVVEMGDTELELEQMQLTIDEARINSAKGTLPKVWRQFFTENIEVDFLELDNIELRLQFRNVLRHMIERITATPTGKRTTRNIIKYEIQWADGESETIEI